MLCSNQKQASLAMHCKSSSWLFMKKEQIRLRPHLFSKTFNLTAFAILTLPQINLRYMVSFIYMLWVDPYLLCRWRQKHTIRSGMACTLRGKFLGMNVVVLSHMQDFHKGILLSSFFLVAITLPLSDFTRVRLLEVFHK